MNFPQAMQHPARASSVSAPTVLVAVELHRDHKTSNMGENAHNDHASGTANIPGITGRWKVSHRKGCNAYRAVRASRTEEVSSLKISVTNWDTQLLKRAACRESTRDGKVITWSTSMHADHACHDPK